MTNHIPNDLSHLSDEEFNSLCPQGEHAPGPEPLFHAAQAVLDAWSDNTLYTRNKEPQALAAALRAAADQVVPKTTGMFISPAELQQEKTRDQLLAIADELEALPE